MTGENKNVGVQFPINIVKSFYKELDDKAAFDFAVRHYRALKESINRLSSQNNAVATQMFLCHQTCGLTDAQIEGAVSEWKAAFGELDAMYTEKENHMADEEIGELFGHAWSFAHAQCA